MVCQIGNFGTGSMKYKPKKITVIMLKFEQCGSVIE